MKPRDLGAAIRKRGWMIIAIVILTTLIATLAARIQKPSYKAEITVSAIAPVGADGQPNPTIAGVYIMIMSSISNAMEGYDVAVEVSKRLQANGIDLSPEELLSKTKAESEVQTSYATVSFTDSSPTRVVEIANTWGEVLETMSSDDASVQNESMKELLLGGKLLVTNQAVVPKKPSQPKPMVYLGLGLFLGLLLGFSTAIGIEYFDPHFRSPQEVEETLDLPVMGTITKLKSTEATTLLSSRRENTPAQEAYSQLRTTLMFSIQEKPSKSIVVISAIPTENAPYITANLAISMAHTERKTLLIDCDLREQMVSKMMNAADNKGLSDALAHAEPPEARIIKTSITHLHLLPAGKAPDFSSDLLSLALLDEYLRDLEREYDELIIHAPALSSAVDGVVVASKANLSLVVIDVQKCSRNVVLSALESFSLLHIVPTGIVLSNVKLSRRERALRARMAPAAPVEQKKESAAKTKKADRAAKSKDVSRKRKAAAKWEVETMPAPAGPVRQAAKPRPERRPLSSEGKAVRPLVATSEEVPPVAERRVETPQVPAEPVRETVERQEILDMETVKEAAPEVMEEVPPVAEQGLEAMLTPAEPVRDTGTVAEKWPLPGGEAVEVAAPKVTKAPTPFVKKAAAPAMPEKKARPVAEKRTLFGRKKVERLTPRVAEKKPEPLVKKVAAPAEPQKRPEPVAEIQPQPGREAEEKVTPKVTEAPKREAPTVSGAPRPQEALKEPVRVAAPTAISIGKTEEERGQLKEVLVEDFRRLGAAGSPIPKDWLRALNAEKPEIRELAVIAIRSYYMAFMRRYGISEGNVKHITESIIMMMRKEGKFASMNEKEAQQYLHKMLVEAGAKVSTGVAASRTAGSPQPKVSETAEPGNTGKGRKAEKERKRKEKGGTS
jgi:tyrosine-protein kinase